MPTKKKASRANTQFDLKKIIPTADSYRSLVYGIVTVIVLFIVIFLGVRTLSQNKSDISNNGANIRATQSPAQKTYTVAEGDSLWSIAEKEYGDGFKWVNISKANNIANANVIEKGTKLVIPAVPTETISPTITIAEPATPNINTNGLYNQKITGNKYTVVKGDYLWEIAIRAYGDGYRWTDIAKANNLTNPDLIYSGNVLTLPK